jgi:2-dehydro-3-deoxygluconokinase
VADQVRVSYYRSGSAGSRLCPDDVRPAFATPPRVLHVTGITCAIGERPRAAVGLAVTLARRAGTLVCLDVNYRASLWPPTAAAAALRPLLSTVDILVASDDELPIVSDAEDPVAALLALGIGEVVVKHGAGGATAHLHTGSVHRPARAVSVLDAVGAGDAFVAGYLAALLEGAAIGERLDAAVTVAAFAVATRGDWAGLPTRAELSLLDSAPGTAHR